MSYRFRIVPSLGLMFEQWEGRLESGDLEAAVQASAAHPDYRPGLDVVADFTRAQLCLSYSEMYSFTSRVAADAEFHTRNCAFIVGRLVERGMLRMFETLTERSGHWENLLICDTFAEARSWLGLPESTKPPAWEDLGDG